MKVLFKHAAIQHGALPTDADYASTWAGIAATSQAALSLVPIIAVAFFGFSSVGGDSEYVSSTTLPADVARAWMALGAEAIKKGRQLAWPLCASTVFSIETTAHAWQLGRREIYRSSRDGHSDIG